MLKNFKMQIILQLGKRKALIDFPTHFWLWKMLKFSNCNTFSSSSSCFSSEPIPNHPFVLHRKQNAWESTHCPGEVPIPTPTHFAAFTSPTAPLPITRDMH